MKRGLSAAAAAASKVEFKSIGVLGAGIMGHGITQVTATANLHVTMVDQSAEALEKGMQAMRSSLLKTETKKAAKSGEINPEQVGKDAMEKIMSRITPSTDLGAVSKSDLVIEAIVENLDVKKSVFAELDSIVQPHTVLASNTSSLPITAMAEATSRPDRFLGIHFFSPVQIMRLVEIVRTKDTSDEVFEAGMAFGQAVGKTAVACKDTPGFIVNRLLVPYMAQAIAMVERGDASVHDVDIGMKLGTGHPMGPLTLADYVGLDTTLFILQGWIRDYPDDPAFFVPPILEKLVKQGHLGRKTGQGFYHWEGSTPKDVAI